MFFSYIKRERSTNLIITKDLVKVLLDVFALLILEYSRLAWEPPSSSLFSYTDQNHYIWDGYFNESVYTSVDFKTLERIDTSSHIMTYYI